MRLNQERTCRLFGFCRERRMRAAADTEFSVAETQRLTHFRMVSPPIHDRVCSKLLLRNRPFEKLLSGRVASHFRVRSCPFVVTPRGSRGACRKTRAAP